MSAMPSSVAGVASVATVIAGAPLGWKMAEAKPTVVALAGGASTGMTWRLVQSSVTKGVAAATSLCREPLEAVSVVSTRSSDCCPQAVARSMSVAAPAARRSRRFTP